MRRRRRPAPRRCPAWTRARRRESTPIQSECSRVAIPCRKYTGPRVSRLLGQCAILSDGETQCLEGLRLPRRSDGEPFELGNGGLIAGSRLDRNGGLTWSGCAVDPRGSVWCWGKTKSHVVGNLQFCRWEPWDPHPEEEERTCPKIGGIYYCGYDRVCDRAVRLRDLGGVVQLGGDADSMCALTFRGEVWCWGDNTGYEGPGEGRCKIPRSTEGPMNSETCYHPTQVLGIPPMRTIAATGGATCGLTRQGKLYCWGGIPETFTQNFSRGYSGSGSRPTEQKGWPPLEQVVIGWDSVCGRTASGEVYCHAEAEPRPRRIEGIGEAVEIAAAKLMCARNRAKEVWCWYVPWNGTQMSPARRVPGIDSAVQIGAMDLYAYALLEDGSVYRWGRWRGPDRETVTSPPLPLFP